jgi:hydroxylamine reductase
VPTRLALADKVITAVKNRDLKRCIVMTGCDGRQKDREYYTEFAKALPKDIVILTAGLFLMVLTGRATTKIT